MSSFVNLKEAQRILLSYRQNPSDSLSKRRYKGKTRKYFRLIDKFLQKRSLKNTTLHYYLILLFHHVHTHFEGSNKVSLESDFFRPMMKVLKMSFSKKKSIDFKHPLAEKMRKFSRKFGNEKECFDNLYYCIGNFPDYSREDIEWIERVFNPKEELYPIIDNKQDILFDERSIDELIEFVKSGNIEGHERRYYILGINFTERKNRIVATSTDERWMMNLEGTLGCSSLIWSERFWLCTLGKDGMFYKHIPPFMREYYAAEELKKRRTDYP